MEQKKKLENAQKASRIHRMRKPERIYSETKIINGGNFKMAEFGVERTTKKYKPKKIQNSSVPKSKEYFAGSFPKCAGENPTKSRKMAGMPTNVKIDKIPENVQKSMNTTENPNWAEKPPKYKSTNVSTTVKFRENNLLENILENVDRVRTVLFKPSSAENVEKRSDSIMKNDEGSHQFGSKNKRKRLEETCEESPKMKKFGIGGGVMVSETNFESKTVKTHEGGRGW